MGVTSAISRMSPGVGCFQKKSTKNANTATTMRMTALPRTTKSFGASQLQPATPASSPSQSATRRTRLRNHRAKREGPAKNTAITTMSPKLAAARTLGG